MKKTIINLGIVAVLMLTGCSLGSSTEKQLSNVMAGMNAAEKEFRTAQAKLTELEKAEQQLFNKTMELTQEQRVELTAKVAKLEESLEQRLAYLEKEESSMSEAQQSAGDFETIIEKVDDVDKRKIEELVVAVDNRYGLHSAFVSDYKKLSVLQRELYEMLLDERTHVTKLQHKVEEVNEQNDNVEAAIMEFNEATQKVNILKGDVLTSLR